LAAPGRPDADKAGTIAGVRTSDGKYASWLIPRASLDAFLGLRERAIPFAPPPGFRTEDV
jgi:hypothetical protein